MSRIAKDLADSAHHPRARSNESTNTNSNNNMHTLKHVASTASNIAIVGAGVAGLRCADVLLQAGAHVTIFEARDRIGGRLHQQDSGGYLMDMGPNWIHGTKGNPILSLAEKTKTCLSEPNEDGTVFDAEGRRRTREDSAEMSSTMWELVVEAFKYSDHNTKSIAPEISLYDYFQSELSKRDYTKSKLKDNLDEAHMWGPFIGESIRRQSLKFFFLEECIEGENVFVASTYKPILEQISQPALSSSIINFNFEVTNISQSTSSISLTTSTNTSYTFDEVILTTPLGWLKHNLKAFTPPLPSPLTSAINNISYGRLEKLYVTFPTAWWLTDNPSPGFPSHAQPDLSSYPLFTHFHSPTTYHPLAPRSSTDWNQSVLSLAHLPSPHAHPTLLFYLYGSCAATILQSISPFPPHSPLYNLALTRFAQPFYALLPNFSTERSECTPTALLMTQWQKDRFAGYGSYSNFQVGSEDLDGDIRRLREGREVSGEVSDGDEGGEKKAGVWFAGEHVAPFVALGTTTGAWWSGEAVGRRVGRKWGLEVGGEEEEDEGVVEGNGGMEEGGGVAGGVVKGVKRVF